MPDNDSPSSTHNTRQKIAVAGILFSLIVIGIACFIAFDELLFAPYLKAQLTYGNGKYSPKLYLFITAGITTFILYPFFWLIKKRIANKGHAEYDTLVTDEASKKAFTFSTAGEVVTVSLDDKLMQIQDGFKETTFLLTHLRTFYLQETVRYSVLMITYQNSKGKIEKAELQSIANDDQVNLLNATLEKRFPERSLNHLSETEAFQQMDELPPAGIGVAIISIIFFIILIIAIVLNWPK